MAIQPWETTSEPKKDRKRMGQDHIRYDILAQDALRGVIRKVLSEVAATGRLPGEHHFFITFLTGAPGVRISQHLKSKYPEQMTIVIQHQFWELKITETIFEIGLSFSGRSGEAGHSVQRHPRLLRSLRQLRAGIRRTSR